MNRAEKPLLLITGVSGLIGTRLVEAFAADHRVVGLDIRPPGSPHPELRFYECDLTSDESVDRALEEVRRQHGSQVASVLHLAAYYDFSGKPSPFYERLTVQGTRRLLHKLQSFETEQMVFSSTMLVMEPLEDESQHFSEYSPTRAEWDYPRSKLAAERVLREEQGPINVVILRIAGVYTDDGQLLPLAQQISRIYERRLESHVFPGDTQHGQAAVHLDDLADAYRRVVSHRRQLAHEETFLIAEPDVMSYGELQDRLGELIHGRHWTTIRVPKTLAKVGAWVQEKLAAEGEEPFIRPWMIDLADDHYAATIAHARATLGWEPQRRLRDTLLEIIRRLKDDPRRWYEINKLPLPESLQSS